MPKWTSVSSQSVLRNYWQKYHAAPLSTSYPASNFYVTNGNGNNSAPGAPNFQTILNNPNGSQVGDPRTNGSTGFYNVLAGNNASLLKALGGNNTYNVGGSSYNAYQSGNTSGTNILIVLGVLTFIAFIFLRQ